MAFHLFALSVDLFFEQIEEIYYAENIFYSIVSKPS